MDFFDRIRADLAASRRRRLQDLAVSRGLLAEGESIEEKLQPSQVEEILRELDGPASRYEIGEKLGEGAVSIVHRGVDRELGRPVALKFLRDGFVAVEKVRERFHREAQSLARMDHPNVVKVHDAGAEGPKLFLVMELVEGGSFGALLAKEPRGSRRAVGLLEQAARGVQHAHERGIVHRDLKPDNILVAGGTTAKVADFGLAHLAEAGVSLTRTGAALGTPMYMAPEQVSGRGDVTVLSDVYALGAILYQVLAGRTPHEGETVSQVYEKILSEDPLPPRQIEPSAPAELEVVALKALEKEPSRRYPSAAAFADELRRWLAGEPVEARPVSTIARAWRRVARNRLRVAAALLVLLAVASAIVLWSRSRAEIEAATARAARVERAAPLLESANKLIAGAAAAAYDAAAALRDSDRARELIEKALDADPDSALGHHRLGEVWELGGYYEKAAASFRRATELNPKFGPAHFRLGRVLLWQGYLASLNMWTIPDPADRERGERLARDGARAIEAARAGGSEFDDPLLREVAAAMIAYLRNDAALLERLCGEGIARFGRQPGVEEFHWLRGLMQEKKADQLKSFNEALAIRPKFPLALYSRAWIGGQPGNGPADFTEAFRCAPGFSEPLIFRGSQYLADPATVSLAIADFDELIRRGVHLAPAYNGRGFAWIKRKEYGRAIADFTAAIQARPDGYHLPWIGRAEARLLSGEAKAAVGDAQRAVEIERGEGRFGCLAMRGRCRAAAGDRAGALEDLKKAGAAGAPWLKELEKQP
ncbi:MAG: protein kinase [Planctomycetes bacterium]|nr:protein kinase [Planctomycetota bacterium]